MTIEIAVLIISAIVTILNGCMAMYVANKTGQIAGIQEEIHKARTDIRERYTAVMIKYNSIEHMHKAVTDDRIEILRTYYKIKEYYETTQKTSSCQYKYEYTTSTV
jgi:hypothetical protein